MIWWGWWLLGLGLLGVEVMTPGGFYVFFFGISALLVGALAGLGMVERATVQWALFSVLSIGSLAIFRRRLLARFETDAPRDALDSLRGEIAVLAEDLAPGAIGKAELRGASWTVRNVDTRALSAGTRCRVEHADGLTLRVRAE
ncbi:MAG: NfeD family protein [Candidatus Binatia bacterium]